MEKNKILIIGNYLSRLTYPLKRRGIRVEEIIDCCNPMAMIGEKDPQIAERAEDIAHMPTWLMARG